MAIYYGNDIGDAARAEERQLDRFLNLGLANRQFRAQQQSRADAIAQANAANAMQANRFDLQLDDAERARRLNRALGLEDRQFDIEERDYGRRQHELDVKTELAEAEKQRALQRELAQSRSTDYLNRLQQTEDQRTFADLAKRVATDDIRDIPSLQAAEGGLLGSEQWVDLKTRLGQRQQRLSDEAALGPEMAAQDATQMLKSDPLATTDIGRRTVMNNLLLLPTFRGKIIPDYTTGTFRPMLGFKYSGPRDAINWYGGGTTSESEAAALPAQLPPAPESSGFFKRMGLGALEGLQAGVGAVGDIGRRLGRGLSRSVVDEPAVSQPVVTEAAEVDVPATVTPTTPVTTDPLAEQKRREVRLLIRSGMDENEAALRVFNKYRIGNSRPDYTVTTY